MSFIFEYSGTEIISLFPRVQEQIANTRHPKEMLVSAWVENVCARFEVQKYSYTFTNSEKYMLSGRSISNW
jgi:hypothetical protein